MQNYRTNLCNGRLDIKIIMIITIQTNLLDGSILVGPYKKLGCYEDDLDIGVVGSLEGSHAILNESYPDRSEATAKCAVAAWDKGYPGFYMRGGGECYSSQNAGYAYHTLVQDATDSCGETGESGLITVYKFYSGM